MEKQVSKKHYDFSRYMTRERWGSIWHQIDEIVRLQPEVVLEVGPGPGVLKNILPIFNVKIETLDLDPELAPDHVGSATDLPFPDNSYDTVCAFQMLEHLPYEDSLLAFSEMVRVSSRNVVISLPDAKILWKYHFHLPKIGGRDFLVSRPAIGPKEHFFDGEHYWEVNKKGYSVAKIIEDLGKHASLVKTYRAPDNLNHRFFIFESAR